MSPRPVQSMPPVSSPGACSMPTRMTKKTAVTTTAGIASRTFMSSESTSSPLVTAPMMTASSSEPTRIAAPAPGEQLLAAGVARAAVDDRDLQRQPDDVRALDRPADQEGGEAGRERQPPRAERRDGGRDQQHLLVPDEVAEPREERDAERADDQLRGLEPVDVALGDRQVLGDLRVDRRVVALQDAAGELDHDEEADDRGESLHGGRGRWAWSVVMRGASRSAAGTTGRRRRGRRRRCARRRSGSPGAGPWSSGRGRSGRRAR